MSALNLEGYRLAPAHLTTADEVRERARRVLALRGQYVAPKPKPKIVQANSINWELISQALPNWEYALPQTKRQDEDSSPVFDPPSIISIQKAFCGAAGLTIIEMRSIRKMDRLVVPRQLAMAVAHRLTSQSYPEIGRRFGGRDHSTAWHAVHKMAPVIAALDPIIETTPLDALAILAISTWAKIKPPSPQMRGAKASA